MMPARVSRSCTIAALAAALLAIAGCGGSSSPNRSKHAVFVPPGLTTAPAEPSPASSRSSTDAVSTTSSGATSSSAGATSSAGAPAAQGSAGSGHQPTAKITFAAPGGESPTAFVSSADAICRSFRARAHAIGTGATTLGTQETELPRLVATTEQSLRALTQLSPPTGDEPGLRRFVTMTAASVIAFADAQSRTRSTSEAVGAQVEAQDLADSGRSSRDAAAAVAAARQLGLHVCGSPGAAWL
jgi:hypothetical protein